MEFNFDDALAEEFLSQQPDTLKDNFEKSFDRWVCNLDPEDLIEIANKYGTFKSQL